jgi:hypothetical protein
MMQNDPQRHMAFSLQSSSCLSRIPPVHPQCITNNSQQVVLLLSTQLGHQHLPLAPRTPNLQPNLCTDMCFQPSGIAPKTERLNLWLSITAN